MRIRFDHDALCVFNVMGKPHGIEGPETSQLKHRTALWDIFQNLLEGIFFLRFVYSLVIPDQYRIPIIIITGKTYFKAVMHHLVIVLYGAGIWYIMDSAI